MKVGIIVLYIINEYSIEIGRVMDDELPARKLQNADSLGLRIVGAAKHSKYATHCD